MLVCCNAEKNIINCVMCFFGMVVVVFFFRLQLLVLFISYPLEILVFDNLLLNTSVNVAYVVLFVYPISIRSEIYRYTIHYTVNSEH